MSIKASCEVSLVDMTDAYSVMLTSEAYTFIGGTDGVPSGLSCETQAVAYCGNSRCSTVSITEKDIVCPTGISATVANNNTESPTITIATIDTITSPGEVVIPVEVDNVVINKKFSFAIANQGSDGKGIKDAVVEYQIGSSGTETPTGEWFDSPPSTTSSEPYLWTRTTLTYTDNTTSVSYSVGSTPEGIEVGGRNLIRNSETMIFVSYGFTQELVDESGNILTDENGNILVG